MIYYVYNIHFQNIDFQLQQPHFWGFVKIKKIYRLICKISNNFYLSHFLLWWLLLPGDFLRPSEEVFFGCRIHIFEMLSNWKKIRRLICKILDNFSKCHFLIRRLFFRSFLDIFSKSGPKTNFRKPLGELFRKSQEISSRVSLKIFWEITEKTER